MDPATVNAFPYFSLTHEQAEPAQRPTGVGIRKLLSRWFHPAAFAVCPACGRSGREHEVRTLARERFAPGPSGVEAHLARRDFARAAALDDPSTLGDQLVHQVVRCGDSVLVVTSEEPVALGLDCRIRGVLVLEKQDAVAAWTCAR
jgi:hypothetical protein